MTRTSPVVVWVFLLGLAPVGLAQDPLTTLKKKQAEIQSALASATEGDALLQRLRVDGFVADQGRVRVSGVFLRWKADDQARAAEQDALKTAFHRVVARIINVEGLHLGGVTFVEIDQLPEVLLQKAANTAKVDDLALGCSRFDARGRLVLTGWAGPAGAKWLAGTLDSTLAKHPIGAVANISLEGVKTVDPWPLSVARVRATLADDEKTRTVRVDRVRIAWITGKIRSWVVHLSGVRIGTQPINDNALLARCTSLCPWKAVPVADIADLLVKPSFFVGDLNTPEVGIPEPDLVAVRRGIVARPDLDGVRIEPGFAFDAVGRLTFACLVPNTTATLQEAIGKQVTETVSALGEVPNRPGLSYATLVKEGAAPNPRSLRVVPTDRVRVKMRQWAMDGVDDVRISRVYFSADPTGSLVVAGHYARKDDGQAVLKQLQQIIDETLNRGQPAERRFQPEIQLETFNPDGVGLTEHLRKKAAADPKRSRGLVIDRGYFNDKNEYTLRGIVEDAKQNAWLVELLKAEQMETEWSAYWTPAPAQIAFDVIPLTPLLDRLRRVAPAHPALDRLVFETIDQTPQGPLTLGVFDAGNHDRKLALKTLQALIQDHPEWKRRIGPGVQFQSAAPTANLPKDVQQFNMSLPARALAVKDLDRAKLLIDYARTHHPDQSATWWLSAIYHHLTQDEELVIRDLRRADALEGPEPVAGVPDMNLERQERYKVLEPVQREARAIPGGILAQIRRDVQAQVPPLGLVETKPARQPNK